MKPPIRAVSAVLIALLFTGCAGYVDVPPDQFEAAAHDEYLSHRIRTKKTEYIAHRFSITDSTLVITDLAPGDTRYRLEKPPFVIPRDEIESIAGVKSNETTPYFFFGGAFLLVALVSYAAGQWSGGY